MIDKIKDMILTCAWVGGLLGFFVVCYVALATPLLFASPAGLIVFPIGPAAGAIAGAILTPILYPVLYIMGFMFWVILNIFESELFRKLLLLIIGLVICLVIIAVIALIIVEWPQIINFKWQEIISFAEEIVKNFLAELRLI